MVLSPQEHGIVYLIGAGPGDPKLISLRGFELLQTADVVLYDYLVNPIIAACAPASAQLLCLGRHGRTRIWTQAEINRRMIAEASAGRIVVRLKGGDPNIFGRLAEEVNALREAGIDYEIVPGISAASAASAYAGVPLTSRCCSSGVAFVTGHELDEQTGSKLDFRAIAQFSGTLVVYMGVTTAAKWVAELLVHGKSPHTPVALVRRCSLPDQQVVHCVLSEVPDQLTPYSRFPPPVIAIIGAVAAADATIAVDRRRRQPLAGCSVLVTRPGDKGDPMSRQLEALGAMVLRQPVIQIQPLADSEALQAAVAGLGQFDWLVFVSAHGVRFFMESLIQQGHDARWMGDIKLAAIGPATAAELTRFGLRADLIPTMHRAEALADALQDLVAGQRVLLVRASRGRDLLFERLAASAATIHQVAAYASVDVAQVDPRVKELLNDGQIDWVVAMSSASAQSLVNLFGESLKKTQIASLSPITSATLREAGLEPAVEAAQHTSDGLIEAICGGNRTRT